MQPFRIGFGYDLHRLVRGRRLVLGGVRIPYEKGLLGHSDADCLSHAIADAILGAAGLRDIGHFFPNTDPAHKDMDSQEILKRVQNEIAILGYIIANIDCTVIAEAPKLADYQDLMKNKIAESLQIQVSQIGIKATTNEGVGAIGAEEAIAAYAVCLLVRV